MGCVYVIVLYMYVCIDSSLHTYTYIHTYYYYVCVPVSSNVEYWGKNEMHSVRSPSLVPLGGLRASAPIEFGLP